MHGLKKMIIKNLVEVMTELTKKIDPFLFGSEFEKSTLPGFFYYERLNEFFFKILISAQCPKLYF